MSKTRRHTAAFTLVELLVVVSIVGLLAVAVLPALSSGGDRRLLRGAAERVDTHLKRAAAVATGKARGEAVWLEADAGTAVLLDLNFARVPPGLSGVTKFQPNGAVKAGATALRATAGAIAFPMTPIEFRITSDTQISLSPSQSPFNAAFPEFPPLPNDEVDYTAYPPPSGPRITSRPTVLPEQSCIDLSSSTIGVYGFGDYAGGGTPTPLNTYATVAICFDSQGRPIEVWGNPAAATPTRHVLSPGTPLALLVTAAGDATAGSGVANADARWVVIDPKTGRNIIVPNVSGATTVSAAQAFIVDDLGG